MSSSRTIAKNSIFLYVRMILTMGVSLYTSRVVLRVLGVEDYGIYGVVGGIVAFLGFFNSAMSSATQRFLSYDIGKGDEEQLQKTFNATLNIHILIAILSFILAETLGLWFVNHKLNIATERMYAANWVYQFSILTFLVGIIQVPYNALIIARERMNVFAYISILDVVLKLAIVYLLVVFDSDKLILYSILTFLVSFSIRIIYQIYCRHQFKESRYKFYFNKEYYKTLISYSGWNLFGNFAAVARGQGNNIVLNLFFGSVLNAAYSISMQVQAALFMFVQNFQVAANPQIIKSYAANDLERTKRLMSQSSRLAYFLSFLIAFPILINTEYILNLWLTTVPPHTVMFVQLVVITTLIESVSLSLMTGIQATGRIKAYQATIGTLVFLNLPLSYIALRLGYVPESIFVIGILISIIAFVLRLIFLKNLLDVDVFRYLKGNISRILALSVITTAIWMGFKKISNYSTLTFGAFVVESILYCTLIAILVLSIGITSSERKTLLSFIKSKRK